MARALCQWQPPRVACPLAGAGGPQLPVTGLDTGANAHDEPVVALLRQHSQAHAQLLAVSSQVEAARRTLALQNELSTYHAQLAAGAPLPTSAMPCQPDELGSALRLCHSAERALSVACRQDRGGRRHGCRAGQRCQPPGRGSSQQPAGPLPAARAGASAWAPAQGRSWLVLVRSSGVPMACTQHMLPLDSYKTTAGSVPATVSLAAAAGTSFAPQCAGWPWKTALLLLTLAATAGADRAPGELPRGGQQRRAALGVCQPWAGSRGSLGGAAHAESRQVRPV